MSQRKQNFIQNIKNYVERGDCGHEGLVYQFEDSSDTLYFANIAENDYPKKTLSEMYVSLNDPADKGNIKFEYIVPGIMRDIQKESVSHFLEYIY